MKYNNSNIPLVCMQTTSTCYQQTSKMTIKGILWHSTGANNTTIKRYVQPSDNDPNRNTLLAKIGTNIGRNDWNHINMQAGLNAWVGTLADGSVAAVQTMPWDYKPWGCGSGNRGSCNNGWIQFEICEDNLTNKDYFEKVYKEACELTAYLCKKYNLNPKGSVSFNGISVPVVLCHQDSAQLGLGSNHADIYHWFTKFGKNMNTVREDVAKIMGTASSSVATPSNISSPLISSLKRDLGRGDEGEDVKSLQQKLIKLGYNLGAWKDDGDFGTLTEKAVLDIQSKYNLIKDGIVGSETMAIIDNLLSKGQTTSNQQASSNTQEIYRIRSNWNEAKTQIGAYKNLNNAIEACKKAGNNFKVFDSNGKVVYPTNSVSQQTTTTTTTSIPVSKYSDVMLGSSSKDERGQYRGGQAGDQTGKEVYILNWYDGGWTTVIRPNSSALAEKIATICEKGCSNNNIGYNQYNRNSIYIEAKKVGLDLSKITTPCDCDCSSFVSTCCICAGLSPNIFFAGNNMRVTGNLIQACEATKEFTIINSYNYTKSKDYLKRGDILVADGHTVIVLSNGSKVDQIATTVTIANTFKVKVMVKTLNVRSGPGIKYAIMHQVKNGGVFTIIEEREGWGRLKSGAGWIDLQYVQKI